MKKLISLLPTKYRWLTAMSLLMGIFYISMEISMPQVMAKIIDIGVANADLRYTLKMGGIMVLFALSSMLFNSIHAICNITLSNGISKFLRQTLFDRIQTFSFSNTDRFGTSSLITRMTTDINNFCNAFRIIFVDMLHSVVWLLMAASVAFTMHWKLACIFFVAIPLLTGIFLLVKSKIQPRMQRLLSNIDKMNEKVQENLIAVRVVKAFVRQSREIDSFDDAAHNVKDAQLRAESLTVAQMPLMQISIYTCIILILWFGGRFVVAGELGTGQLLSFIVYVNQILHNLISLTNYITSLFVAKASIQRIKEILDEVPDIPDDAQEDIPVKDGSISFENVSFGYHKEHNIMTLKNISFSIASGETIGIIGGTGCAKSTLVQLIPRLYEVNEGSVKVGGRDVREYKQKTLREQVSMVLQTNILFSGTILDNLRWGNPKATDEEIYAACQAAQAHDFITSFPDGYQTKLGQGGVNVSGGQKQRLCIARALLKKPKVVILDDSTSAVDTATDAKIRDAIHKNLADTTTLIIAQRITSVCDADRIIVMDKGEIYAIGTHQELLETCDIYREIYLSQQKGVA